MKKIFLLLLVFFGALNVNAQLPFTQTTLISGLYQPVAFAFAPDDNRIFVTQKPGQILVYNFNGTSIGTFYNLADSTVTGSERGVLGICFDPDYNTNHYLYVYYNHRFPNTSSGNEAIRILRFTDNNSAGTNPAVIMNIPVANTIPGNHVGGNIRFRPSDGKLYIAIGELGSPANATVVTNPFGKILRINKDGSIPPANPFYDDGNPNTGNDDRIWEYGHRNPFDFTFGSNDSLYITENGASARDECNLGRRGGNYGWYFCEGDKQINSSNPCNTPGFINPLTVFEPIPAVTGIIFYDGCMFPEYKNHLLVGSNKDGLLFDCTLGNAPSYNTVTSNTLIADIVPSGGLTTLMVGPEGAIYALNGGYTANGNIYKLSRAITPSVTAGGPTTFCKPATVVLTAAPAGFSYQWYNKNAIINEATSNTYTPSASGNYLVKICDISSNTIKVKSYAVPPASITPKGLQIICTGSSLLLQANSGTGFLYQWTRNNLDIIGATNSSYLATKKGVYRVVVTKSTSGCTRISAFTRIQTQPCARLENTAGKEVNIFPNPGSGEFTVKFDSDETYRICVTDLQGRILNDFKEVNGQIKFGAEWSTGIYLLQIENSNGYTTVRKLVKTE